MAVRIDGPESHTTTRKELPTGANQRPPRRQPFLVILIGALAVAVITGVLVGVLVGRGRSEPTPTATSQPTSDQLPEALPRSAIVAGGGGLGRVFELRTGYPHTTAGAVQAAMNFFATDVGPAYYNQKHYEAIQAYMFVSPAARQQMGYSQATVNAMRKQYQVNDDGIPLTSGRPDATKRIWDAAYLQYGAYRIVEESETEVRVMMWSPYVYGVDKASASTTANLSIGWALADKTLTWSRGDWRQSGSKSYTRQEIPTPADPTNVVTTFAERADLLGTDRGWTLPANATETDTPELKLPGK